MVWNWGIGARLSRSLIVVVALAVVGLAATATAQEISAVRVVGNARAEDQLVFDSFGLNPGDAYQVEKVRQGVRNLYRQGLFRDVTILGEQGPDGVIVTIRVRENPTLLRIRYEGADKLGEGDFEEVVELVPGQLVTPRDVDQARRDIVELYEEKGYLLVEVTPEFRGEQRADLLFRIEEGHKVQIEKISFTGNAIVAGEALREVMDTSEDKWWGGGDFRHATFEEDKKKIEARLGEEGFVDARVNDVKMTFSEDQKRLFLEIDVTEGPQYRVGQINVDHGGVIPEVRIRNNIFIGEGDPFNTVLFEQSTAALYSLFHEQGYIYANVDVRRTPRDGHVIDVDYVVQESEPARINRIVITGNTRTKEKVIRRQLMASPGDVFKRSRVIRSQREVFSLGFFNDIQLDSRTADPSTGAIDLILNVEERQTGTASLGAGVNSQAGLTGFVQLSQNNFLGKGQILSVRGEFGRFRELELSFTEPWLFDTPTTAGADIYDTRRIFTGFTEKRRGGDVRIGRPFPWLDYTRASARYSLGEYRIEARPGFENEIGDIVIDPNTQLPVRDPVTGLPTRTGSSEDLISAITLTFFRNSVDSPFFPTRGSSTRWTNEWGGGVLGGDQHYYLMTLSTQSYFRLVGNLVLSLRGAVGVLNGLDIPNEVPFWKRFRLGGIARYGVRGYDDFTIVPNERLLSTGGRSMVTVGAEFRYPIVQSVQGLMFFDAGNTWATPGETDVSELKKGVGVGVRIDVPMVGQLGFDYGYGFDRTPLQGGPGWEFHFQIGGQRF